MRRHNVLLYTFFFSHYYYYYLFFPLFFVSTLFLKNGYFYFHINSYIYFQCFFFLHLRRKPLSRFIMRLLIMTTIFMFCDVKLRRFIQVGTYSLINYRNNYFFPRKLQRGHIVVYTRFPCRSGTTINPTRRFQSLRYRFRTLQQSSQLIKYDTSRRRRPGKTIQYCLSNARCAEHTRTKLTDP